MCFTIPTITNIRKSNVTRRRRHNPNNLRTLPMSSSTIFSFPIGLWNCQSAVNKADFITSISSHSGLSLLALTETWIRPEDTATPAALSTNFTFSHTPRLTGRGGGTGLLISNDWKFNTLPPLCNNNSFESHSITITSPIKIHCVVVYRPPGQLGSFLEDLDVLLSSFPEDGTPLIVLGDFNIHLEKPQAADFHTLLASFDLKRVSTAATHKSAPLFLEKWDALSVISRQKRSNAGDEEAKLPASLERECLEEVCDYEEAREVFQDNYRTDIFWSVYIDGDQCADHPCRNGAMCSDSVGGYDCICKSGFSGIHCETDQTVCVVEKGKGCSQFCKPGYQSYECSCAYGWKLKQKEKCEPAVSFPCGKLSSLSQWDRRQSANIQSDYEGLACGPEECPWQAMLRQGSSAFCSGVVFREDLVLTSAQCVRKYSNFQVAVGKRLSSFEAGEQTLHVKQVHIHPLYAEGQPGNDLAVVELKERIVFKKLVLPACLPERDFSDSVLMAGDLMGVVTGWRDVSGDAGFQGNLMLNHLSYDKLPVCSQRHSGQVSNKMACTLPRSKADCVFGSGSPVLTLYRDVFFLTGIISRPAGAECAHGYVLQKVSRSLPWLNGFLTP